MNTRSIGFLVVNYYDFVYYRASENTTSASRGRLNNADSAWCFHYEKFAGQKAFFTVDLQVKMETFPKCISKNAKNEKKILNLFFRTFI